MTGGYADWRGHVIVCGLHSVGLRIVEELNLSGVPAVVVDDHPDVALARQPAGWGVPCIAGSSRTAGILAARTTAPRRATLRDLYGALAPIAVLPAEGEDAVICPGRDHMAAPGDRVTVFATPDELRAAGIGGQARYPAHARPFSPLRRIRNVAVSLLRAAADRRIATALAALVIVLIASTTILHLTYRVARRAVEAGAGGAPHVRLAVRPVRPAQFRVFRGPVHRGAGRALVRRRGAWPGRAQHLLRRRPAAAGRAADRDPRRRPEWAGHGRPVGPHPGAGHPPGGRRVVVWPEIFGTYHRLLLA